MAPSLIGLNGDGGELLAPVSRSNKGEEFEGLSWIGLKGGEGEFLLLLSLTSAKVGDGEFFKPLGGRYVGDGQSRFGFS